MTSHQKILKQITSLEKCYTNHSKKYYEQNFNLEDGIWRRRPVNTEERRENSNAEHAKMRRIELIKVLKHFTKEKKFSVNSFIGHDNQEPAHSYDHDTYCCCGENSSLYVCQHVETGMRFYLGSSCIKLFDPHYDTRRGANLKNGTCKICSVPLRCKSNNKAGIKRNYSPKKQDNICFECEPKNFNYFV